MQYYRVWIYSCNIVLGITSAIFIIFGIIVFFDSRRSLGDLVEFYHPTFLYAYAALFLQCGVLQTIGCFGAQKLNHKLLSLYWLLLFLLTIGDIAVGLFWVFKLDKIKLTLKPVLQKEFYSKYSIDPWFTAQWDNFQENEHCCGVEGPYDYFRLLNNNNTIYNESHPTTTTTSHKSIKLPESCCITLSNQINLLPLFNEEILSQQQRRRPPSTTTSTGQSLTSTQLPTPPNNNNLNSNSFSPTSVNNILDETGGTNGPSLYTGGSGGSVGVGDVTFEEFGGSGGSDIQGFNMNSPGQHKKRHFTNRRKPAVGSVNSILQQHQPNGTYPILTSTAVPPSDFFVPQIPSTTTLYTTQLPSPSVEIHHHSFIDFSAKFVCPQQVLLSSPTTTESSDLPTISITTQTSGLDEKSTRSTTTPATGTGKPAGVHDPNKYVPIRLGCRVKLIEWLDYMSGIAYILGFCIIGFIKFCFLFILRYEIKEMIGKIALIEKEAKTLSPSRSIAPSIIGNYIKSPTGTGSDVANDRVIKQNNFFHRSNTHSTSQETMNVSLLGNTTGEDSVGPSPSRMIHSMGNSKEKNVLIRLPPKEGRRKSSIKPWDLDDLIQESCELLPISSRMMDPVTEDMVNPPSTNKSQGVSFYEPIQMTPLPTRRNGNNNLSMAEFGTAV